MAMATIDLSNLLTSAQVADALGISADSVRKYCQWGKLTGIKVGRDWFVTKSEVKRYQQVRVPAGRPARES